MESARLTGRQPASLAGPLLVYAWLAAVSCALRATPTFRDLSHLGSSSAAADPMPYSRAPAIPRGPPPERSLLRPSTHARGPGNYQLPPGNQPPRNLLDSWLKRMFRCGVCGNVGPPHTKAANVVLEARSRHYPLRLKANRFRKDRQKKWTDDPGGQGSEIVREVKACPSCGAAQAAALATGPQT